MTMNAGFSSHARNLSRPRTILVCPTNPWDGRRPGGIRTYVRGLASSLTELGMDVTVVTTGSERPADLTSVHLVSLSERPVSTLRFLALLLIHGEFARHGDIVHLQRVDHLLPLFLWTRSVAKVVTLHGETTRGVRLGKGALAAGIYHTMECCATLLADTFIAVNDGTREAYEHSFPWLHGKIRVVPIGIQPRDETGRCESSRIEAEIPENAKLILFCGRLVPEKNPSLLLEALPRLLTRVPEAFLVLVGEGPSEAKIKRLVQNYGSTRIRLVPPLPRGQLWHLIRRADVVAIPSMFESGPVVALDAIAARTPFVATPVGRIPEILSRWRVGEIATADPAQFAIALAEVLEHGKEYYTDGCNAAASTLSFDSTVMATMSAYQVLLARQGGV